MAARNASSDEITPVVDQIYGFDVDQGSSSPAKKDGTWIGIDLGTSHCGASVWDSAGGRSKWLRLGRHQLATPSPSKLGRLVPSAVLFFDSEKDETLVERVSSSVYASVGQAAINVLNRSLEAHEEPRSPLKQQIFTPEEVSEALVTSLKRIWGISPNELREDSDFLESLPFSLSFAEQSKDEEDSVKVCIRPLGSQKTVQLTPLEITVVLLRSIRLAAQDYLQQNVKKKGLLVPAASTEVNHCVVGVPARFGQAQRHMVEQACRLAGFQGHVSTLTESTAAAMAYGLFVAAPLEQRNKNILVFDMGGGTTDVTIASMVSQEGTEQNFSALVTEGDGRLGGDDMDEVILKLVLEKIQQQVPDRKRERLSTRQRRLLLSSCRHAKEVLCGGADGGTDPPAESSFVVFEGQRLAIMQEEFNQAIAPLMQRAKAVVSKALDQLAVKAKNNHRSIDEVVLVGGATRVPALRRALKSLFSPKLEFCTSINPDGAVAQGLAVEAAIRSGLVPKHELRSALMLDAIPHSIGVQVDTDDYIPILSKDMSLPARGYATFVLGSIGQPGVTVVAVEDVQDNLPLQKIGEFTFLLKRLSEQELRRLPGGKRTVDIGMALESDGQFVVSIFDPNDPEHIRKRQRYQKQEAGDNGTPLSFHGDKANNRTGIDSDDMTMEQYGLILASVLLFILYIAAKLAFHEPDENATII